MPSGVDPQIPEIEGLARWLDYAFVLPGGFRFGFAGVVGLVPGLGDVVDALVSLYIVGRAIPLGIPRVVSKRSPMKGTGPASASIPTFIRIRVVAAAARQRLDISMKDRSLAGMRPTVLKMCANCYIPVSMREIRVFTKYLSTDFSPDPVEIATGGAA